METIQAIVDGFPNTPIQVEMLGTNLARVVDATLVFNPMNSGTVVRPVRENDIVRLSHCPDDSKELPRLTEIVYKASPRFLSTIKHGSRDAQGRLIALAAILGAEVVNVGQSSIDLLHAENIDIPAIARAAGIGKPGVNFRGEPRRMCRIPFSGNQQITRMIAIAVVLGAEFITRKVDPDEIIFRQVEGMDLVAVADAAQISPNPDNLRDLALKFRPGALPGPEWGTGSWGDTNENPAETGAAMENRDKESGAQQ